jgi:hypothetical protein
MWAARAHIDLGLSGLALVRRDTYENQIKVCEFGEFYSPPTKFEKEKSLRRKQTPQTFETHIFQASY